MNDSQRIDALKLLIINLIDIMQASDTDESGSGFSVHNHGLFDDYDRSKLEELRGEAMRL